MNSLAQEEFLLREMHMHYGRAIIMSQNFEKLLASLLRGMLAKEHVHKTPYKDFVKMADKLNDKAPLGELLKEVKARLSADEIPEELFEKVRYLRNHLIHNYFFENASKETVVDGKLSIINELIGFQQIFVEAAEWADKMNKKFLYEIGMTDEKLAVKAEELRQTEVAKFRAGLPLDKLG
jgi:hypothetical protein